MSAKVDNAAVQDGFQLYHHSFFFTTEGSWCVVQQGMNDETSMARRYHWLSDGVESFVNEPHAAICGATGRDTLNLVADASREVRTASVCLASAKPEETLKVMASLPFLDLPRRHAVGHADINPKYLGKILLRTYERAPADFEALLGIEGVGAKTLRALALTSELIYGCAASRTDPARYSFAHGGKDSTPFSGRSCDLRQDDRSDASRAQPRESGAQREGERVPPPGAVHGRYRNGPSPAPS